MDNCLKTGNMVHVSPNVKFTAFIRSLSVRFGTSPPPLEQIEEMEKIVAVLITYLKLA
jgi:hypothetical protein